MGFSQSEHSARLNKAFLCCLTQLRLDSHPVRLHDQEPSVVLWAKWDQLNGQYTPLWKKIYISLMGRNVRKIYSFQPSGAQSKGSIFQEMRGEIIRRTSPSKAILKSQRIFFVGSWHCFIITWLDSLLDIESGMAWKASITSRSFSEQFARCRGLDRKITVIWSSHPFRSTCKINITYEPKISNVEQCCCQLD